MKKQEKLHECAASKCGHIYLDSQTLWLLKENGVDRQGACPVCSHTSYWIRNQDGTRPSDLSAWKGVDLNANIAFDHRVGGRVRKRIKAAVDAAREEARHD